MSSTPTQSAAPQDLSSGDALVARLFEAAIGMMEIVSVYLGDRLGLYSHLADAGDSTSVELAERAGTDERYTREWLEQQAVAGFLAVDAVGADPQARRYSLPPGHA
ncbi:MAG: SAM-dependent methyltransferase, partial [Chloroflexia bacterium]